MYFRIDSVCRRAVSVLLPMTATKIAFPKPRHDHFAAGLHVVGGGERLGTLLIISPVK